MKFSTILLLIFGFTKTLAQTDSSRTHYYTEAGTYISTSDKMPFWLRTNQYGIVPNKAPIVTFRGGIYHDYAKKLVKKYDWGFGIDAAINVGAENKIYLPEAYIKVKLNKFELYAGRRREIVGLVDTTLTSGSYIWSGNALPIPKIQLSIPEYLPIKFTRGLISFKGSYAHGWFDNSGVVKDFYLHQKTFYARLGKSNWKVKMYGGFNHQAQWGGYSSVLVSTYISADGKTFPANFADYINLVSGVSIRTKQGIDTTRLSEADKANRVGNHLGSIDLGMEINFSNARILIYRQNIYEDGSLYQLINIEDGLNGISWEVNHSNPNKFSIQAICVEFLNTTSQGGRAFNDQNNHLLGQDNYFNHGQYIDGWTYGSNIIGTPFITTYTATKGNLPSAENEQYHKSYSINNNRVNVFYLAVKGRKENMEIEGRLSYSKNYGTYLSPFPTNTSQFSLIGKLQWSPTNFIEKGYWLTAMLSADVGELYTNNLGIYLGIRKRGII